MIVENKIIKMRVCSMMYQDQVWGNISFLTSVGKKGMKDKGKDAKIEDWNLGNFLPKFSNYPPNYPNQTLQA